MSKSNTKFIATVAFGQGICQSMAKYYLTLDGREKFKKMLLDLYNTCDYIITNNKEKISRKDAEYVKSSVTTMNEYGLENAKSYQTYLSFLIGIVSERIEEISKRNSGSLKQTQLNDILEILIPMYEYFETRTRNDEFDKDALKLMNNFNLLF